ncbi:glycosyltransferase [Siminovitchia sediminis]|uniref:Glycosyltransferase n=1 Tax=Siminovitchia sediminis TaxID=1274353 RepID=A0ABW4KMF3_9BACI
MKQNLLITSFDLAIGGVERSLLGLLHHLDYSKYQVDVMLFKHEGEFMPLLPSEPTLLEEVPEYSTFRMSIFQAVKAGHYSIGIARFLAKYASTIHGRIKNLDEPGYLNIQYGWKLSNPFLPKLHKPYDAAISFLWPHYFISKKVEARKKIGWIHTDYSNIYLNKKLENEMWNGLDHIVAVSDECLHHFLTKHPDFKEKASVIENILSPEIVKQQAAERAIEMEQKNAEFTLLTVGRLSHAKGLDLAIKACKKLVECGFSFKWYVVGFGPLQEHLEKTIQNEGLQDHFILLGKKINPYPYIQSCDIYVQPSRYEGKAVTIREAQILGKAVVMTDFPTANSQAENEVDALIQPLSPEGIAKGIERLFTDRQLKERLEVNVTHKDYGNGDETEKLYRLIGG